MHKLPHNQLAVIVVVLLATCLSGSIVYAQEEDVPSVPDVILLQQESHNEHDTSPRQPIEGNLPPIEEDVGASATNATIFAENFSGVYPGNWRVGHSGGSTICKWRWPRGYADMCVDASNNQLWYPNNLHVYMERHGVSLVGYQNAELAFDLAVDVEGSSSSPYDKLTLKVRDQSGVWRNLRIWTGPSSFTYSRKKVDLSRFAGQSNLTIRFQVDTDGSMNGLDGRYNGVEIDNIILSGERPSTCKTHRNPVDVVLAIDRSGSMRYAIGQEKTAANGFVNRMALSRDQVALVSFSDYVRLDQVLTRNETLIKQKINSLITGGNTNISGAIETAHSELRSGRHNPNAKRVLILMTDGQPNDGDTPSKALAAAQRAKSAGIRIFVLGLGSDIDANLLRQIASSHADYYQPPTANDLTAIYQQIANKVTICKPGRPRVNASNGTFGNRIRVTWNSVSNAEYYEVWRSPNSNRANATRLRRVTSQRYQDYRVVPGRPYWYWIRACNWNSCGWFSLSDYSCYGWRPSTLTWLPSIPAYGYIPGGDRTHRIHMRYGFSGRAGEVYLVFQTYDVDSSSEIGIYVNGRLVAYAPGRDNAWSGPYAVLLTDNQVKNNWTNVVTFRNRYNPPNSYTWGVRKVAVAGLLSSALESLEAKESGTLPVILLPAIHGNGTSNETDLSIDVVPEEELPVIIEMLEELPELVDTELFLELDESEVSVQEDDPFADDLLPDAEFAADTGNLSTDDGLAPLEAESPAEEIVPDAENPAPMLPSQLLPFVLRD